MAGLGRKVGYQIALPENLATVIEALNGNPAKSFNLLKPIFHWRRLRSSPKNLIIHNVDAF